MSAARIMASSLIVSRIRAHARRTMLALLVLIAGTASAFAHASLISSTPAEGAMVESAPHDVSLTFNEPVTPLVMRLIDDEGVAVTLPNPPAGSETVTLANLPPMPRGTHTLSWRVISADGHPVGGSLVFSVGVATSGAAAATFVVSDKSVSAALWLAKIVIYVGLFIGVGGAFFRAFIAAPLRPASRTLVAVIAAGAFADIVSVGLQGADALGLSLSSLLQSTTWTTGFSTSYGNTASVAAAAFAAALAAMLTKRNASARALSTIGVTGIGFALALSGHASTAPPQGLTRPSVFLHAVCIAFWIGSLVPLAALLRRADEGSVRALQRFSRIIPYAVGVLIASGALLAIVQLGSFKAIIETAYGNILVLKLATVCVIFGLAVWNRFVLTPAVEAGDGEKRTTLARSIIVETGLVLVVLALVAGWRFTPPPRALAAAAAEPAMVHIHTNTAMADVTLTPGHAGPVDVSILLRDGNFSPLTVKEVALSIENPQAGVEPISRPAKRDSDGLWHVPGMVFPLGGRWTIRLDILITDFDKVVLDAPIEIK